MEIIRSLLSEYKRLIELGDEVRKLDYDVFIHIERAAKELASALTALRMRGKLDPELERKMDEILIGSTRSSNE